jgi:Cu/Ag efflux protein CusF
MKRSSVPLFSLALLGGLAMMPSQGVLAQPAKGAPAAFERVREVMNNRFKDMKLEGDPDRDFAAILIAHHEDLIFLAKMQLEFGGDRALRQLAQKILDEQQKQISDVKEWQVRNRQADYRAQPDQPAHGSGPLDQRRPLTAAPVQRQAGAPVAAAPAASAAALPMVSGTVEKVDTAAGKLTIDHGPIPNLNMDGMTMVFRVADPALLKGLKARDKVQFQADRVNGQLSVVRIQKGK